MSSSPRAALPWEQAEGLRSPDMAGARDPRNGSMVDLEYQHSLVAGLVLNPEVPEKVRIAFDTARNLYLYAWHVYRFYPVAELQALIALEAGLRAALPERLPSDYQHPRQKEPMLHGLLRYAIDHEYVRNEGFSRWHEVARDRARQRAEIAHLERMERLGLDSIEIDEDTPLEILPEDQGWDLVSVLKESLHRRRNGHAHGDGGLTGQVRGTIELVAEVLNQMFAAKGVAADFPKLAT